MTTELTGTKHSGNGRMVNLVMDDDCEIPAGSRVRVVVEPAPLADPLPLPVNLLASQRAAPADIDWTRINQSYNVVTMDVDGEAMGWDKGFNDPVYDHEYGFWAGGACTRAPALDNYVPRDQAAQSLRRRPT